VNGHGGDGFVHLMAHGHHLAADLNAEFYLDVRHAHAAGVRRTETIWTPAITAVGPPTMRVPTTPPTPAPVTRPARHPAGTNTTVGAVSPPPMAQPMAAPTPVPMRAPVVVATPTVELNWLMAVLFWSGVPAEAVPAAIGPAVRAAPSAAVAMYFFMG